MLLEDRLEVEAELRKKEKAQYEEVAQLKASVAALQQEKQQLAQSISHVAKERDQARAEKAAAVSDANCMHAMLQDAGTYIEHMRNDIAVLQMNLQHARAETMSFAQAAAHAHAAAEDIKVAAAAEKQKTNSGGFGAISISMRASMSYSTLRWLSVPRLAIANYCVCVHLHQRWITSQNPSKRRWRRSKRCQKTIAASRCSVRGRGRAVRGWERKAGSRRAV